MSVQTLERNLFWLIVVGMLGMAHLCVAILMPFYATRAIGPEALFLGEAAFGTVLAICLLPAGYLADRYGRVRVLAAGFAIFAIGVAYMLIVESVCGVVISQSVMGIGCAGYMSTRSGLLYDTLKALNRLSEHVRWSGFSSALAWYAGAAVFMLAGFLFNIHPDLPIWGDVVLSALTVGACLMVKEPPVVTEQEKPTLRELPKAIQQDLLKQPSLFSIMLFGAALLSASKVAFWLRQPYMLEMGLNPAWYGVVAAAGMMLAGAAAQYTHRLEQWWGRDGILFGLVALQVFAYAVAASVNGYIGLVLMLVPGLIPGLGHVLLYDALHHRIPSARRATFTAVNQLLERVFSTVVLLLMAAIVTYGADAGLVSLSLFLLAVSIPLGMWVMRLGGFSKPLHDA